MFLKAVSNYAVTTALNSITLDGVQPAGVDVVLEAGGNKLLSEHLFPDTVGVVTLHGYGDIISLELVRLTVPALHCVIRISGIDDTRFTALLCGMPAVSVQSQSLYTDGFLLPSVAAVCPPGAPFTLSWLGEFRQSEFMAPACTGISFNDEGAAHRVNFTTPTQNGVYTVKCGTRVHQLFVFGMGQAHRISFRNMFGAREHLYLRCRITDAPQRSASVASCGGIETEYDFHASRSFQFEAKAITPAVMRSVMFLPYAYGFSIDGVPVAVTDLKPEWSGESQDLGSLKFEARVTGPSPVGIDHSGIFTSPFDHRFS